MITNGCGAWLKRGTRNEQRETRSVSARVESFDTTWHWLLELALVRTRSSIPLARVAWARCTVRAIHGSIVKSLSSCCRLPVVLTRRGEDGVASRRGGA